VRARPPRAPSNDVVVLDKLRARMVGPGSTGPTCKHRIHLEDGNVDD
jgi:hypothetical protein